MYVKILIDKFGFKKLVLIFKVLKVVEMILWLYDFIVSNLVLILIN